MNAHITLDSKKQPLYIGDLVVFTHDDYYRLISHEDRKLFPDKGPWRIDEISNNKQCIQILSGRGCTFSADRFIKIQDYMDLLPDSIKKLMKE